MKANPYLEVILAAIIWGSTGPFIKWLQLPPTTITFFRAAIPCIVLLGFFYLKKTKLFKKDAGFMALASSLNAVRMLFYFIAFTLTSIGNAVIMLYTWPIFVALFSVLFLKEKISGRAMLMFFLSFSGIVLVYGTSEFSFANQDFLGMTAMLVSAAVYSLTVIIFKKKAEHHSRWEMVFYQNMVATVVFFPFVFINKPVPTGNQLSVAVVYALLIGIVGFGLFYSALKKIKASTASLLCYVEVVSGMCFGVFLFQEVVTWNLLVGGGLIIFSTVLLKKEKA